MGDILKYGLLAVGGYLLYNAYVSSSTTAAAAPAAAGSGPAPAPPAPTPAPAPAASSTAAANDVAALKTWAASQPGYTGTMTSDQWHYGWINVLKKTPVPDANFFAVFPGGTPPMTADAFVAALQTQGLSGLGWSPAELAAMRLRGLRGLGFRRPLVITAPAAASVMLARARQLRNAGVQNYQLAGTPMPRGSR